MALQDCAAGKLLDVIHFFYSPRNGFFAAKLAALLAVCDISEGANTKNPNSTQASAAGSGTPQGGATDMDFSDYSYREPEQVRAEGNRLLSTNSVYLRQHAHNPVDWYPWGEEAFNRAVAEDKPIFLSIGYSSCHWCHVMEEEVFEDDEAARYLNEHFICIKVDREERPDIDAVYMDALQMMTGGGGWPMSMFLTPELKPFYGGTYMPKGMFMQTTRQVSEMYSSRPEQLEQIGGELSVRTISDAVANPKGLAFDGKYLYVGDDGVFDPDLSATLDSTDPDRPATLNSLDGSVIRFDVMPDGNLENRTVMTRQESRFAEKPSPSMRRTRVGIDRVAIHAGRPSSGGRTSWSHSGCTRG